MLQWDCKNTFCTIRGIFLELRNRIWCQVFLINSRGGGRVSVGVRKRREEREKEGKRVGREGGGQCFPPFR